MQIEPHAVASQLRLLAGSLEAARLDGRGLAVRLMFDAARRLDDLAADPGSEAVVDRTVPGHMLTAWGDPLPGLEWLED